MPFWSILLICAVPIIIFFYFSRKVLDQIYDSKPIVCEVCGKSYTQIKRVVNGSTFIECPRCGARH